ncbi:putative dienelactone hydrolase [Paenibacillus phyllosphaerae]|uniref:Putative dienelactone hydrolase n=1 Tax=Paenibacillus phyllosphaerae TaxID=274593 RepID=A0A7W5B5I3_9BACL|nr:alpha/beta fold hydrolase [Paenibacillus phyllosphaerae]MBB3114799.1 putative dienelactone hydrolase [Paenibacillus phyllosphaerae]
MNKKTKILEGDAGCYELRIADPASELTFPMIVMYPTDSPEKAHQLGPYLIEVAEDAEPREGRFPLIIISHGSGGSPLVYRSIAQHLARCGFIVGLPEHPHNNRNDNSLEGTITNLTNRPRHLSLAADWFYEDERFKGLIESDNYSVIGHSMGGYTGLAVAGGIPTSFPNESPDGQSYQINITRDRRLRSLILLAPASVWFRNEGALREVDVPILMMDAEHDSYTPSFHSKIILDGVAIQSKVRYRTVENAGHFSFLSPFPPAMISPGFIPSQDPPGFDRVRFHETLLDEIVGFLSS